MANSDRIYRSIVTFFQFFSKGWGPVETYERLAKTLSSPKLNRSICKQIIAEHSHPVNFKKSSENKSAILYEGSFLSPLATYLPGVLPTAAETVRFEFLVPKQWRMDNSKPVFIHLAGTGDHFFWRRKYLLGYPLLKNHGVGSLFIENPYYGYRKPREQFRSQLHYVSDLFLMGLSLIFESMVLGDWIESMGMGPVGLTGLSMGGYNASLTASLWPKPVVVVPCLSWATASSVFTEGALSSAVCWNVLEEQLLLTKMGQNKRMKDIFDFVKEAQAKHTAKGETHTLPDTTNLKTRIKNNQTNRRETFQPKGETVQMLRWMLDYTTHLHSYPCPISPNLALFVVAKDDLYVPRGGVADVRDLWPGCEVSIIDGGHVSSHVMHKSKVVQAMVEKMDKFSCNEYHSHLSPIATERMT